MITLEMYRMMEARQFAPTPTNSRARLKRATNVATVNTIHRLLDEGLDAQTIAERLGVTRATVDYRKQKLKGLR